MDSKPVSASTSLNSRQLTAEFLEHGFVFGERGLWLFAERRRALGWLETSIRSYAKFVDVAARATASDDGEAGVVRRERVAIDEVRALLDEMMDEGDG